MCKGRDSGEQFVVHSRKVSILISVPEEPQPAALRKVSQACMQLWEESCWITTCEFSEGVQISYGSSQSIIIESLHIRRVPAKFLPKQLLAEQIDIRDSIAQDFLDCVDENILIPFRSLLSRQNLIETFLLRSCFGLSTGVSSGSELDDGKICAYAQKRWRSICVKCLYTVCVNIVSMAAVRVTIKESTYNNITNEQSHWISRNRRLNSEVTIVQH